MNETNSTQSNSTSEQLGRLPLDGLRVLELSHYVAGPSAGLILAELGADTIRIEPLVMSSGGTQMMLGWSSFSHRNKRAIALDLKLPQGKQIFLKLAREVDVVLDNFAPGAVERLGLSYELLSKINHRLIYLSIKGFLPGPYQARPLLDELAQTMGGLAYMTGPRGKPMRAGSSVIDIGAATYGVVGVLAALYERERSGEGQRIEAGLFETSVFLVAQHMALAAVSGEPSVPMGERPQAARMGAAVYELFRTLDEKEVFIGVTSDAHWERMCQVFRFPDLLADERLKDRHARSAVRERLIVPRLREVCAKMTSLELQSALSRAGLPFAPLQRPDELFDDPHLLASGQLVNTPIAGRDVPLPKLPFASSAYQTTVNRPAPRWGEHTREVLSALGYSETEVERLARANIVGLGGPES
jgi:crotonobetainyl-CoA:carnitine CoA-transferase CaiB-like acyl-CoA transferase